MEQGLEQMRAGDNPVPPYIPRAVDLLVVYLAIPGGFDFVQISDAPARP